MTTSQQASILEDENLAALALQITAMICAKLQKDVMPKDAEETKIIIGG